ncbi:MAG: hypothetical protein EU533_05315, partial [Promethearchaeota archaeon]
MIFKLTKFTKKEKIITIFFFLTLLSGFLNTSVNPKSKKNNPILEDHQLIIGSNNHYLFQGNEQALNITDYALYEEQNQKLTVNNGETTNISYFLDELHQWRANEINFSVKNIRDTREWMNDSGFYDVANPYRKNLSPWRSNLDPPGNPDHNYSLDLSSDPTDPGNVHTTINEPGAIAMRLHFDRIEIE